jgi:hypothetical protein
VWNDATVKPALADAAPDGVVDSPSGEAEAAPADGPPAPLSYLDVQDGARLCALSFTCTQLYQSIVFSTGVPIDPNNFSLCMEWATGPIPPDREGFALQQGVLKCTSQATSCLQAGACQVFENLDMNDPRCAGSEGGVTCTDNGNTKLNCGGLFAEHCNNGMYTPGTTCQLGADGTRWCSVGPLDAGCPAVSSCIGTLEDYCGLGDNLHARYNCSTLGNTCTFNEAGSPVCGTQPCTTVAVSCTGTTVAVCDGNEISPFECASLGGSCAAKSGAYHCTRPNDACTPLDADVNQCTGTSVSLCIGGVKTSFDCMSIGKACLPGTLPQTGHCG